MDAFTITSLSKAVGAAGVLGTASFGIVEALKWTRLGVAGFGHIRGYLGQALEDALRVAYGADYSRLLAAQYRQDSKTQAVIAKSLRQGVRIGLTPQNAEAIARFLGSVEAQSLSAAAKKVEESAALTDADRAAIGRFELAADARIESALSRAQDVYIGTMRCAASVCAILLAEVGAMFLGSNELTVPVDPHMLLLGLFLGVVAVPLAPIANDIVTALQAVTQALRTR